MKSIDPLIVSDLDQIFPYFNQTLSVSSSWMYEKQVYIK